MYRLLYVVAEYTSTILQLSWSMRGLEHILSQQTVNIGSELLIIILIYVLLMILFILLLKGLVNIWEMLMIYLLGYIFILKLVMVWIPRVYIFILILIFLYLLKGLFLMEEKFLIVILRHIILWGSYSLRTLMPFYIYI